MEYFCNLLSRLPLLHVVDVIDVTMYPFKTTVHIFIAE